jgi:tripartite-type tricarboxylate transporter receptor subunit TctC
MPRLLIALCAVLLTAPAALGQQNYPHKPIRYVVPFPAGGIADVFARIIGGKIAEAWGQPVVVENRAGAGGNIGAELVAKSAPDGYTLLMGSIGTQAVNASLYRNMPYDSAKDFTAVALVIEAESLLALHPSVAAGTPADLIALARSQPGKLTGNACRDCRETQFGNPRRDAHTRRSTAPSERRRALHADDAGAVRGFRRRGDDEVGKADPRNRYPRGLAP